MKLTNEEKQTISKIIDRLIIEEIERLGIERGNLLLQADILTEAKQTIINYVVEGQS